MPIQDCPDAPHKVVIWIRGDVYELLRTGEISGRSVESKLHTIQISGKSREECVSKLTDAMEKLKQCLSS